MLSFQQAILLFLLKGSHDCSEIHQRGCHARTVNETVLENVVVQAINTLLGDRSTYQAQLQQNIAKIIREAQKNTADGIDGQLMELQKELLEYSCAVTPQIRQMGNHLSGNAGTAYASLLA